MVVNVYDLRGDDMMWPKNQTLILRCGFCILKAPDTQTPPESKIVFILIGLNSWQHIVYSVVCDLVWPEKYTNLIRITLHARVCNGHICGWISVLLLHWLASSFPAGGKPYMLATAGKQVWESSVVSSINDGRLVCVCTVTPDAQVHAMPL